MIEHDPDGFSPAPRYVPSGWFNVLALVPLLALGVVVALAMALVLLLLEDDFYYYFLTPGLVGVPVFAMVWAIGRLAHCRNAVVGTLVGLTLAAVYYVGFWELSYYVRVVRRGPAAVALVRAAGGAPGLPGYFNFRCKNSVPVAHPGAPPGRGRAPNMADRFFNYGFFGGEALMIAAIAAGVGLTGARRVYYERPRRWSSKLEFRLPPSTLPAVLRAVKERDWAAIAALPRVSSMGNANSTSLLFRVEYLAGSDDEPAYVSLTGTNLGKLVPAGADGSPVPVPRGGAFLKQVTIEPASARELARHFPDIKLAPAAPKAAVAPEVAPSGVPSAPPARAAEPDFRDRAVAASRELLDDEGLARPWEVDTSCCRPTGEGRREVRSSAWWKMKVLLLTLVLLFAMLGLGAWASEQKDPLGGRPPLASALMAVGVAGAIADAVFMLAMLFAGDGIQKRLLSRRLGARPGSLLEASAGLPTRLMRLENAQTYHVQKLAPEDLCVCAFDRPNRRVLMEGISHRYVVRDVDVTSFWPLQSGDKVSVRIDYRVGDEPLALVLAADNPLFHVFHGAFAGRTLKSLVRQFVETFDREFPDAVAKPGGGV
jgi:hypothetical protein